MKGKLKILYVSAEVYPFTRTGGAAEVAGALPKSLKALGHDVRVMMPNYRMVNERKYVLRDVIRLQGLKIKVGDKSYPASAKSAFIPDSKVQVYFLDSKHFFDRNGIYADPESGKNYDDNAERFLFFARGCLETLKLLYWQPDIIHCNDWPTAVIPLLLKTEYREDAFFKNTKSLFSIHNFRKQGDDGGSVLEQVGLLKALDGKKREKGVSFLELGLKYADHLSTVSKSYASEIQKKALNGYEFGDITEAGESELTGIVNGIDEDIWNPEDDDAIPFKFSRRDLSGKYQNKEKLLAEFNLEYDESTPLISTVSALDEEKGTDVLIAALDSMLQMDVQVIVMGRGKPEFHKNLQAIQKKYPKKLGLKQDFDSDMVHLLAAGSDFFLMPSRTEPCGLTQLYGQAYGAIPIVHRTGGLADTVQEFDAKSSQGTGFFFDKPDPDELLKAVKKATNAYGADEVRSKLIQNAMKQNFSWKTSVRNYVKLYQKLQNSRAKKSRSSGAKLVS